MIRVSDPARLGPALKQIRDLLGISRYALARQIAEVKGRSLQACVNQLAEWDRGVNSPNVKSLGPVLAVLGYDLALIPREDT